MEIPYNPELSENQFQPVANEFNKQNKAQGSNPEQMNPPEPPRKEEQQENRNIQIPPKADENQEEILIGIYLKKANRTIDYYYNREQLDLILYNRNLIIGILENIKLDILTGEKPQNG